MPSSKFNEMLEAKVIIRHDYTQAHRALRLYLRGITVALIQLLLPRRAQLTHLSNEGITLTHYLGQKILVPWPEMNLLDLTSLDGEALSGFKDSPSLRLSALDWVKKTRSFKFRVHDAKKWSHILCHSFGKYESWHTDVLTIKNIPLEQAPQVLNFLRQMMSVHGLSEDLIIEEW